MKSAGQGERSDVYRVVVVERDRLGDRRR